LVEFLPQLADAGGGGEITASVEGSLRAPRIVGELRLFDLASEVPALGLKLRAGTLSGRLHADRELDVSARIGSGSGTVTIVGTGTLPESLELAVEGREFLAADIPGARVLVSPQLALARKGERLDLTGTLVIPSANVDLNKLGQGGGQSVSPDVVVIDREQKLPERGLGLATDVTIVLGDEVKLVGFGLDAKVAGQVRVRELAGEKSLASGEIRLEGTYQAYGRKLTIERGRLQFAGTPLDDPQLDVLAIRRIEDDDVTARLRVTGTARSPRLEVSADPAMSSTEALSYLVAGKSVDTLRGEEGTMVHSAAALMGDRLTRGLSGSFGVDEVGVEQSDALGGSAFTVGKYLSPRFFVSYGVGLFEPGQVVTLRYEISDQLSIEANQAPEDQYAGFLYRIER
jgi:translocation and assembly module TamB